ncbi:MAG: glycosyltransferase, partial [Chlamydiota bacterium]
MRIGLYTPYPSMVDWYPELLCRVCRELGHDSHTATALDACADDDSTFLMPFNNYLREDECARLRDVCRYPVLVQTEQIHRNLAYLDRFVYHQRYVDAVVETLPELMGFTAGKTDKPVVEMSMGYHESMRRSTEHVAEPIPWDLFCLDSMTAQRAPYFDALDLNGIRYYRGRVFDCDRIAYFARKSKICLTTHAFGPSTALANPKVIGHFISNSGFVIAQRSDYPYLKEGRHIIYYDDPKGMIERVTHYLAHQNEAGQTADRALAHIRETMKMEANVRACLDAIRAAEGRVPVRNPGKTVVPAPPSAPSPHTAPVPVPPAGPPGQPRVSVVIPCHNLGHYLDETVDSVLCQTLQDFEIIIVDDGSTDEYTRKLLSAYAKPRTTVITIGNKGPSGARNEGVRRARAPFVLCLDADDVLDPSCLEKCCRVLEEQREVGVASFWYRAFGEKEWEYTPASCALNDILVENRLCGNSMFRRRAWEEVGGYDESFRSGYEDWEFWIAVLGRGYRAHIIQEILFNYRIRHDSRDARNAPSQIRSGSMEKIITKHADLFKTHASEVLLGKEKIYAATLEYQRELLKAQEWYKTRDREHECYAREMEEAKQWYLSQLEQHRQEIERTRARCEDTARELSRSRAQIADQQHRINVREHELRAVFSSKAWKLGCAVRDARHSIRAALLL